VALATTLFLATIILVTRGAGVHGTQTALAVTARVSFLWFWAAYAGGALTTLFGPAFLQLEWHGRELGLAFAPALFISCWSAGFAGSALCQEQAYSCMTIFSKSADARLAEKFRLCFHPGHDHRILAASKSTDDQPPHDWHCSKQ
jgi:hypothetical protein